MFDERVANLLERWTSTPGTGSSNSRGGGGGGIGRWLDRHYFCRERTEQTHKDTKKNDNPPNRERECPPPSCGLIGLIDGEGGVSYGFATIVSTYGSLPLPPVSQRSVKVLSLCGCGWYFARTLLRDLCASSHRLYGALPRLAVESGLIGILTRGGFNK